MEDPRTMDNDTLIWRFTAYYGTTGEERLRNYGRCLEEMRRRGFDTEKVTEAMDRAVAKLGYMRPDPTR